MITVETIPHSGGLIVSALVGDGRACGAYLESHTFYGYGEVEAVRLFVERCHARGQRIDDDIVYEAPCLRCGAVLLTDEWHGGEPYFGSGCECGGEADSAAWNVSDEPHPSVWGEA